VSSPSGRRSGAIVAGQADPGHPAVGFLASSTATMHCSGTLIAPTRVLTAAHCLRPPALDFVLGTRRYSAKAKRVHPHYDPDRAGHEPFTFDLGIVILAEPVLDVPPAILAAAPPRVGEVVTIVGYGLTQAGAGDPGTKRRAQTTITRVTRQNFWIGAGHKTPPTTCNGDSGGPTFLRRDGVEVLLGVHSATEDAPVSCLGVGFDVRVDVFAAWIVAETARTNLPAGDPCDCDADCAADLRCAPTPYFVCARPCDTAGVTCPGGERCHALAPPEGGSPRLFCLPGSGGDRDVGQACGAPGQCRDGLVCLTVSSHGPLCTASCEGGATCPPKTTCDDAMFRFTRVCLPDASWQAPAPALPPRRVAFGATCQSDAECESGLCRVAPGEPPPGRCTQACGFASACPEDYACAPLDSRHLCMPEGGCALAPGSPGESSSFPMMLVLLWGAFGLRRVPRRR